jgi:chromosome partitioning protein
MEVKVLEIISVNITKGGCGKTTTVQMLGEILSREYGKKILCIDTDPQCNLTTVSGVNLMECQEHNLYTLLKEDSTLDECIVKSKYYDIIAGSLLLAYADTEFNQLGREYLLKERLESANYDMILIDTPPSLGLLNIMSLTVSTKIIIPTECSYLAMIGLDQLSNTIKSVRKHSNKDLEIAGILLIKYSSRANINNAVLSGLEKMSVKMNTKVFNSKIRETVKVKEAQSQQEPIIEWDASCSAVKDYLAFTKELTSTL